MRNPTLKLAALSAAALFGAAFLTLAAGPTAVAAADDATEIMKNSHLKLYYSGENGRAVVSMTLTSKKGKTRTRKFIMMRSDIEDGGAQKYYTYFLEPNDVRKMSFMVWKNPDADDSRWLYVPAMDLVKRISSKDKGSSFVGSDFSYEDVSGRHWSDDAHVLAREEEIDGEACWVIESTPKEKDAFSKKISWISKEKMVPLKEEYYDSKDRLDRTFRAEAIEEVDGYLTVTQRRITSERKGSNTLVAFEDIDYDMDVDDSIYTERYLKNPPKSVVSQ